MVPKKTLAYSRRILQVFNPKEGIKQRHQLSFNPSFQTSTLRAKLEDNLRQKIAGVSA